MLRNKTILPSQCDCIVASLREAILPIQAFYKFLEKQERGICSSRYPVIYALIDCEALLEELITLVSALRECCLQASPKTAVLLTDIQQKIDALFRNWKTMQRRVTIFFDRMRVLLDEKVPANQSQGNIVQFPSKQKPHRAGGFAHL